ncbi:queuosine precursor transporter [Bacillus hwajinpoensis]|uniref:Probable queuosine precursor transporter n=1 Tax=Guptibacillus hwajinpoensis TaxID=208199 RepID=A0A845F4R4_9BACL|nr:queuosine precursor transporter [Pseudalkalibacillus hwajinpoensis]MYL65635.1 queuosine precursor transporter [Pseudalkalibacillus hwajinpoensis]
MKNQFIDRNLVLFNVLFATSIVIANVLAGKVVMIGSFVIPAAVVMYAFSFLFTDIIHEKYGKEEAKRTVQYGFIAQVFASIMIYLGMLLPVAPFAADTQAAYEILLGQNYRFVLASLAAYLVSQHVDVYVFSLLKKRTSDRHKWLRNNVSTFTSQLLDTTIFITIAFAGTVPNLWVMVLSQFVIKMALALLDTPVFYLLTRLTDTKQQVNNQNPLDA